MGRERGGGVRESDSGAKARQRGVKKSEAEMKKVKVRQMEGY